MVEIGLILLVILIYVVLKYYSNQSKVDRPISNVENQQNSWVLSNIQYERRKAVNAGQREVIRIVTASTYSLSSLTEEERGFLIEDAVVSEGGIIEFIQAFLAGNYKNEFVLLGVGQYSLSEIIEDLYDRSIRKKSEEEEYEEEYGESGIGKAKPLVLSMPTNEFQVRVNGNQIHWKANQSLLRVFEDFVAWDYVKELCAMGEDEFTEAFITNEFYKHYVYSNNGSDDITDYVNELDVTDSQDEMESRTHSAIKPKKHKVECDFHAFDTEGHRTEVPKENTQKKNQHSTKEDNKPHGKLYKGAVKGFPIAVVEDGVIFEGLLPWGGKVLGNLTDGNVYEGIVRAGIPIATLSKGDSGLPYATKSIYKPFSASIMGYYQDKYVKTFPSGKIVANYEGDNEGEALATAFVLGLLTHK